MSAGHRLGGVPGEHPAPMDPELRFLEGGQRMSGLSRTDESVPKVVVGARTPGDAGPAPGRAQVTARAGNGCTLVRIMSTPSDRLAEYRRKRDFKRTAEPPGARPGPSAVRLAYVIQRHEATRLHFDLRLELDGVMKSWAVPK